MYYSVSIRHDVELRYIGTAGAQTDCASMKCLRTGGQEKTHHAILCWLSNKRSALIAIVLRRPRFLPSYLQVRAFYRPTHTLVLVTFSFIGYHTETQGERVRHGHVVAKRFQNGARETEHVCDKAREGAISCQ